MEALTPIMPLLDPMAWCGGAAVAGLCLLAGWCVLPRLREARRTDAWLLRAAVGIGPLAAVMLAAGQVPGLVMRLPWGRLGAAGLVAAAVSIARDVRRGAGRGRERPDGDGARALRPGEAVAWAVVALWLVLMLAPAFAPPVAYDVLEYHLGIVAHVFETGHVTPIPGVFYTAQPLATEMLYLPAAVVEGDARGAAPGVVQWLLFVLATLLWVRLGRALRLPRVLTPLVWLVLLAHPIIFGLQLDCLTDATGMVLLLAGLWVGVRRRRLGGALVLGLLAGGAVAAKWTNAGTVLPMLALLAGCRAMRGRRAPFREAMLFGAGVAVPLLPWIAWLALRVGNPFAPFLAGLFPTEAWRPEQLAFLMETHGRVSPLEGVYWTNLARRLTVTLPGLPLVALGMLAAVAHAALRRRLGRPRLPQGAVAASLVVGVLAWGQLLHAADRFLAPLIVLGVTALAVLAAGVPVARWRRWIVAGVGLLALAVAGPKMAAVATSPQMAHAVGLRTAESLRREFLGLTAEVFDAVNALPEGSRLLAINEARRAPIRHPVALASVFDRQPVRPFLRGAADGAAVERALAQAGFTHVLVNEFEQVRLLRMHTPPALLGAVRFQALLAMAPPAGVDAVLAGEFAGYTEFAADPLSDAERAVYLDFLRRLRGRAVWQTSSVSPAAWIAQLEPNGE